MKSWEAIGLSAILLFSSCQKKIEETQIENQALTLRLNLAEDPSSLDPRIVRTLKSLTAVKQLFDGLTRLDEKGIPQPAVAQRIEVSKDGLNYSFHLRETYWTNGDPVTAYDFEYAWKKVLDPHFATDYAYLLYPIKNAQMARMGNCDLNAVGVHATNEKILVVELENPTPYFLELTSFPTFFPVNQNIDSKLPQWAHPPGKQFVCNGPFLLKKWISQSELHFAKNLTYWDRDHVNLDKIIFSMITDNFSESLLYEKGELDWLGQPLSNSISPEQIEKFKSLKQLNFFPVAGTFWFLFNVESTPFQHPKMRKAFSYALNRKEIIQYILTGNQIPATGPVPLCLGLHQDPYFQDNLTAEASRLFHEALKELKLARADLPKITLNYSLSERNSKISQLVQQQWEKVFSIPIYLEGLEYQVHRAKVKSGTFQIGTGDWIADFNDPISFLEIFKNHKESNGSGMNDTGWENAEFRSLLNQSIITFDQDERTSLLQKAEHILVEEMPIAPVYHYAFDYVKNEKLADVFLSPQGQADFKNAVKQ
jgi:oligopeptide transport system substrate-binding protein